MTDLEGELEVQVVGPVTRVDGSIRANGGWIELLGRRYQLDRVRIGFTGKPEIDPDLDVRITRETTDAQIAVEVHGTARKPKVAFTSDPPIYSEAQIIGIVVSGDPQKSRVSDRSLDQKVVGALSGLIVGKLKDQLAPGLPIDVIRVETGDQGYTGLAPPASSSASTSPRTSISATSTSSASCRSAPAGSTPTRPTSSGASSTASSSTRASATPPWAPSICCGRCGTELAAPIVMPWMAAVALLMLWLVGGYALGAWAHVVLALALLAVVIGVIRRGTGGNA